MSARQPRPILLSAVFALIVAAVLGCSGKTPVKAPSVDVEPLPQLRPKAMPYRLQVGDVIEVKFWGSPELDEEVLIRPDGFISLPFVDEVEAAGLTPSELDTDLTRRYSGELMNPQITVIVRETRGQKVFIGGEVEAPQALDVDGRTTLLQAIQQAGYFTDTARRKQVLLIRTLPSGERVAGMVNMLPIISGENPAGDILLQPSDIVVVPRAKITNMTSFLERYFYDLLPIHVFAAIDLEEALGLDDTPE